MLTLKCLLKHLLPILGNSLQLLGEGTMQHLGLLSLCLDYILHHWCKLLGDGLRTGKS